VIRGAIHDDVKKQAVMQLNKKQNKKMEYKVITNREGSELVSRHYKDGKELASEEHLTLGEYIEEVQRSTLASVEESNATNAKLNLPKGNSPQGQREPFRLARLETTLVLEEQK
jgi:hypothetical protein